MLQNENIWEQIQETWQTISFNETSLTENSENLSINSMSIQTSLEHIPFHTLPKVGAWKVGVNSTCVCPCVYLSTILNLDHFTEGAAMYPMQALNENGCGGLGWLWNWCTINSSIVNTCTVFLCSIPVSPCNPDLIGYNSLSDRL